jgi:hypothetical protein
MKGYGSLRCYCRFSKEASIVNAVAQVVGPLVPSTTILDQGFSSVLDLNLKGLWLGQREEIKQMLEQEPLDGKYFPL